MASSEHHPPVVSTTETYPELGQTGKKFVPARHVRTDYPVSYTYTHHHLHTITSHHMTNTTSSSSTPTPTSSASSPTPAPPTMSPVASSVPQAP